jgi:pimeloyl-ACP methyl ester carboxylesterase
MTGEVPRLHFETAPGSDPGARPVLFLHGSWHGAWTWGAWLPPFAEAGYNPIALDFRGHGKSEGSWRKARLRDYVDDARRAIASIGPPPVLVGHSLGGLVIQHLLTEGSFPSAVLIAPIPGRYPPQVIGRFGLRHPLVMTRANLSRNLKALVGTEKLVRETLFTQTTPGETIRNCHARLTGASPALFREMVQTEPGQPKPGTPTVLIAPELDSSFTPAMQRRLAEKVEAEYIELEGSGHDVPLDASGDRARDLILKWLGTRAGATGGATERSAARG